MMDAAASIITLVGFKIAAKSGYEHPSGMDAMNTLPAWL